MNWDAEVPAQPRMGQRACHAIWRVEEELRPIIQILKKPTNGWWNVDVS